MTIGAMRCAMIPSSLGSLAGYHSQLSGPGSSRSPMRTAMKTNTTTKAMTRGLHSSTMLPSQSRIADKRDCGLWKTRSNHPFG